jgi:hypothetical protein
MIDVEHNDDYLEGQAAYKAGKRMADKPAHMLKNDWDAGWLDAMAAMVRVRAAAAAPRK